MKNPGRAGLTADRLGDGEKWVPKAETAQDETEEAAGSEGR